MRFKSAGGMLVTNKFAMKGTLARVAFYEATASGSPDSCAPGAAVAPTPPDTSTGGLERVRRSGRDFALAVIGGRLGPIGALSGNGGRDPFGALCPDQSLVSAGLGLPLSKQRRDVHKLLRRKSVRSISLSSGGLVRRRIPESDMGFPATDTQNGGAFFEGRWTVKLTRIR